MDVAEGREALTYASTMRPSPTELLQLVPPIEPAPPAVPSRVALTETEQRAVVSMVGRDCGAAVIEHVVSRATALASADGPAVRRRSISKAIAILDAQLAQLSLLMSEAVARRDFDAVAVLDRAATGVTKRLCGLLQEHRFEETRGIRSAVVVGIANNVTVGAAR